MQLMPTGQYAGWSMHEMPDAGILAALRAFRERVPEMSLALQAEPVSPRVHWRKSRAVRYDEMRNSLRGLAGDPLSSRDPCRPSGLLGVARLGADRNARSFGARPALDQGCGEELLGRRSRSQAGETVTWSGGACVGGLVNGQGTLTWYLNGRLFGRDEGTFKNGELFGHGRITRANGASFEGEFPGKGVITLANGQKVDAVSIKEAVGWSIEQAPPSAR